MSKTMSSWLSVGSALLMLGFLAGCGAETPSKPADKESHDHDHDHDQEKEKEKEAKGGHEHGPNGGEIVELEGEGEHFHMEWERDTDSGLITFYLLDKDLKNVTETDAAEITLETKVGDKVNSYALPRSAAESETAKTTKFEITDKALATTLSADKGVTNTVKISIGGKPYTGNVKHDPDHDHH